MSNPNPNQPEQAAGAGTNHIDTVRAHLLDQLKALRSAGTPELMKQELERSKGVSDLAQAIVNTAKVEVDYLKATGQDGGNSKFLAAPATPALPNGTTSATHNVHQLPPPGNGITAVTRHMMKD